MLDDGVLVGRRARGVDRGKSMGSGQGDGSPTLCTLSRGGEVDSRFPIFSLMKRIRFGPGPDDVSVEYGHDELAEALGFSGSKALHLHLRMTIGLLIQDEARRRGTTARDLARLLNVDHRRAACLLTTRCARKLSLDDLVTYAGDLGLKLRITRR